MKFSLSKEKEEKCLFYKQSREHVRTVLASNYVEFRKSQFSSNTADNFNKLGVHCFYDEYNLLQEIEIFRPSFVSILDIDFLGKRKDELEKFLSDLNIKYDSDDMGVIIEELGVSTVSDKMSITECIYFNLLDSLYINLSL
ncbi:hypothetical protein [Haemophilus haemolyticus]|uniref:hypothetical protein n=1 Tax=Haemophilus haemolyticus TaxID=726 RepID=UPI000E5864D8|nr:hypothetical protein [Haemophilus haemolyticus]